MSKNITYHKYQKQVQSFSGASSINLYKKNKKGIHIELFNSVSINVTFVNKQNSFTLFGTIHTYVEDVNSQQVDVYSSSSFSFDSGFSRTLTPKFNLFSAYNFLRTNRHRLIVSDEIPVREFANDMILYNHFFIDNEIRIKLSSSKRYI